MIIILYTIFFISDEFVDFIVMSSVHYVTTIENEDCFNYCESEAIQVCRNGEGGVVSVS